ncbi:hypothetical protein RSOLAG1IB_04941 [Rhizoctonia solani AG-1 IB]|uniref:G-patch domain-containing protein n=1 Tax=Thanatephorus cucumeris (strain AG1-IB / isolate 7/3/14) TaxID=1108050 RepID=A0A0B7FY13_THACB|nr:hypothetical protein RSOLAG1IB_04941 [Rhizoctonia solani AG-1 IB]
MATEAFTIVSNYDKPGDEILGTVQKEAVLSSDIDALWESEAGPSNISLKRRIPPRFVPASNANTSTYSGKVPEHAVKTEANDIASWYAGLSRSQTAARQPESPSQPELPSSRSSSKNKPSKPSKNDWFIHRALSNLPKDDAPVQNASLADMLQQAPPSLENPIQPPVFLHLGPNNRGWGMLQRHGWEEGRPLGLGSAPVTPGGSIPSTPSHELLTPSSQTDGQDQLAESDEVTQASSRTALITPLRTTLKVDKRGIGPRSKSMPKPAVTHSLSDIRLAAERARRERDGRGKRGFARTARREAEERSQLFQELK